MTLTPPQPEPTPDVPVQAKEPFKSHVFTTPIIPEATQPTPETGPTPVSEPETTPSGEMPLRKQATYRKQAPAKLKKIAPQQIKPQITTPTLTQPGKPLIPPQKYHSAAPVVVARQPEEHPPSELLHPTPVQETVEKSQPVTASRPQRTPPEDRSGAQSISAPLTSPVPMALAYPPRRVERAEQVPPTPQQPATPTDTTPIVTAPQKSTPPTVASSPPVRVGSVQNVIQRKWPENEGGSASGDSDGGQAAESSSAGQAQPGFDLAQLAEDVFPYVKRLIEIESDRVSSRFR